MFKLVYSTLLASSLIIGIANSSFANTVSCVEATKPTLEEETLRIFNRNIGIFTPDQLAEIANYRVGVAGVGGIGGEAISALVALGISKFSQADPDTLEETNRNKQILSSKNTEGLNKVDVTERYIKLRNPNAEVTSFAEGITRENIDQFLDGVDIVVDGIDIFEMSTRRLVFMRARERGIPVLTVAPLGKSVAIMLFTPESMSYDRYFDVNEETPQNEHFLKFMLGVAPKRLHKDHYHLQYLRMNEGIAPSYIASTKVAAGHISDIVRGVLLKESKIEPSPRSYQYDFDAMRLRTVKLAYGNRGPIQRLKFTMAKKIYGKVMELKE